ncbi:tight adherence pilus pseudopilin TadF [Vibrio sp. St2]|uniref:tight adherence pilus pseudopilin TadF n=1 Tax=Vibrio sp. St2 TaxID=2853441 RepID=UPI00248EDB40|nr:tight adherence pilus pseudopilin TadF [Vibrio sp. St2]
MMRSVSKQNGATVIEFPFVVLGILTIVLGLFAVYKLLYLQSRVDSTAYSMASAAARALVPQGSAIAYDDASANQLLSVAQRSLPTGFEAERIGLVLEIRTVTAGLTELVTQKAGSDCEVEQTIDALSALAPVSRSSIASLRGKTASLYQVTLCVSEPLESDSAIFNWLPLPLPTSMRSQATMIGRRYSA